MIRAANNGAVLRTISIIKTDLSRRVPHLILLALLVPVLLWTVWYVSPPIVLADGFSRNIYKLFMGDYRIDPAQEYILPVVWVFINSYMAFILGVFPFGTVETSLILSMGSRRAWWWSKCVSLVAVVLAEYIFIFAPSLIVTVISGESVMGFSTVSVHAMLLPVFVTLACSAIQAVLNIMLRPVFGCMTIVSLQIVSTFLHSPLLFTSYSQLKRTTLAKNGGIEFSLAVPILLGIIMVCAIAGAFLAVRMDFINKKE